MSRYAVTPETYDAWRHLEVNKELRTYERDDAAILRGEAELELLYAGTKSSFSITTISPSLTSEDLEKSPTAEKIENYFKLGLELQCFAQRHLTRTLERYHCRNICLADLEARPGAYPDFGTEEEVRRYVEEARRKDAKLAQATAEIKEGQRHDAETEDRLAALNNYIATRRARGKNNERGPDIGEMEWDNGDSEPDVVDK